MARRRKPVEIAAAKDRAVLDVTVVLLEGGLASTAIGPIEVFHSAGMLWNWLHGETRAAALSRAAGVGRRQAR